MEYLNVGSIYAWVVDESKIYNAQADLKRSMLRENPCCLITIGVYEF